VQKTPIYSLDISRVGKKKSLVSFGDCGRVRMTGDVQTPDERWGAGVEYHFQEI